VNPKFAAAKLYVVSSLNVTPPSVPLGREFSVKWMSWSVIDCPVTPPALRYVSTIWVMPVPVNVNVAFALPEFAPLLGEFAVPWTVSPPITWLLGPGVIVSVVAPLAVYVAWTSSTNPAAPFAMSMSKIVKLTFETPPGCEKSIVMVADSPAAKPVELT
jgi:hypothetical protein